MKQGRSALGIVAGVALALGLVALSSSGFVSFGARTRVSPNFTVANSTSAASENAAPLYPASGAPLSRINSIGKQSVGDIGVVILPAIAATLLGFMIYRGSSKRVQRRASSGQP